MDQLPNEVLRMVFEPMAHRQRMAIARVTKLWRYLLATFPRPLPPFPARVYDYNLDNPSKIFWLTTREYDELCCNAGSKALSEAEILSKKEESRGEIREVHRLYWRGKNFNLQIFNEVNQTNLKLNALAFFDKILCRKESQALGELLTNNTIEYLEFWTFRYNQRLSNVSVKSLVQKLKQNSSLIYLNFSGAINLGGAKHIPNLLKGNSSLCVLKLCHCMIDDKVAKAIAEALKLNRTLTNLDIAINKIGVEGGIHLAAALKENTTLTDLNIWYNWQLGSEGCSQIADALKINNSLKHLNISCCGMGIAGAQHFAEALAVNNTLTHFICNPGCIEPVEERTIRETIRTAWKISGRISRNLRDGV